MTQPLDTELKGSPDAILSAIDFLRSCIDAHQTVIDERETYHRYVQSWKGTAGDAYLNYRNVLTDAHHSTIELLNSFVTEFESCAQQLTWRQEDMEQVRKDAADAGLDVIGMKVMPPTMRRPLHPGLPPDPTVAIDHPGAYKAAQEGCEEMSTIYAYWQRQVDE